MKFLLRLCRKICSDGSNPNRRTPYKEESETLGEDRISALADPLLFHILSLLPMHEAIRTSVLSKRWKNIWIYVPSLNFKLDGRHLRCEEFVSSVTKTLALHRCSKIDKFSVIFLCKDVDYAAQMDLWINFAVKRKVEVLDLSLLCWQRVWWCDGEQYRLPEELFACSSVREMKLLACLVEPIGSICWGSLKSLSIHYVKLTDDTLEKILSGSPVLEVLELCEIQCFNCLSITIPSLRKLVLRDCSPVLRDGNYGYHDHLEIWAPYLQSLSISGYHDCKIQLLNVSSLVDAFLDFDSGTREEHRVVVWEILERLRSVKYLTLGAWFIQAISLLGVTTLPSILLKCRHLTLRTDVTIWELYGLANLLQILPYLETLDIDMRVPPRYFFEFCDFSGENNSTLQERYSKCSLLHLKDIKIFGYKGQNLGFQLQIVQFLLKKTRAP